MNFLGRHASKATKVFVASVLLGSISFGAYGLGRAARPASFNPKDGYFSVRDSWVPINSYCNPGCSWNAMTLMTTLKLPTGSYLLTANGMMSNDTSSSGRVDCQFEVVDSSDGVMADVISQNTLNAGESVTTTSTGVVRVISDAAVVRYRCGTLSDQGPGVAMLAPSISAHHVATLKSVIRN